VLAMVVACGEGFTAVVMDKGDLWLLSKGAYGQLRLSTDADQLLQACVGGADEVFDGEAIVLVAAGDAVAVTLEGELWVWGFGGLGQLGLGDKAFRLAPTLLGAEAALGESQVLTVACGYSHSLLVTDGALWTFGSRDDGALGHNYCDNRLVPMRIEAQHFGNANIVSVTGGSSRSAAVTEKGTLYTWGQASDHRHANAEAMWVPTRITPSLLQGARVGRCHDLPPMHALVFAMGTHSRLGSCAVPTAMAAGGSSQRRSHLQEGKMPSAADKG